MVRRWLMAATLLPQLSLACLWDKDTLADEARGIPSVLHAIVGRVETEPPLYYEMRLQRETANYAAGNRDLDLFDNCAVACDKLGRSAEAETWLARKLAEMDRQRLPPNDDHRYRYHANLGTVLAHAWARSSDRSDTKKLERGIAELEEALKINPDAHFGRERVQVVALRALLKHTRGGDLRDVETTLLQATRSPSESLEGIVGMMAMGGGPDQPDLVGLIALAVHPTHGNLKAVAKMRYDELRAAGKPAAFDPKVFETAFNPTGVSRPEKLRPAFERLRANAEEFRAKRTAFMLERLQAGRHPDTDGDFWDGYREVPALDVEGLVPLSDRLPMPIRGEQGYIKLAAIGITLAAVGLYLVSWRRRAARMR